MRPRWLGRPVLWVRPADAPPDGSPDTRPLWRHLQAFVGWRWHW